MDHRIKVTTEHIIDDRLLEDVSYDEFKFVIDNGGIRALLDKIKKLENEQVKHI